VSATTVSATTVPVENGAILEASGESKRDGGVSGLRTNSPAQCESTWLLVPRTKTVAIEPSDLRDTCLEFFLRRR